MTDSLVVTVYGHDDVIDKIAISTFESVHSYRNNNARTYCDAINKLELREGWVRAKIISANVPFSLEELLPKKFNKLLLSLDSKDLQKVLREIDKYDIVKALKGCYEDVFEKVRSNVSVRCWKDLKSDMDYMGPVRIEDIQASQEKIMTIIRQLEDSGEIVFSNVLPKSALTDEETAALLSGTYP